MIDNVVETEVEAEAEAERVRSFTISLKCGAGSVVLEDIDAVDANTFRYIIQQGLETIVNTSGGIAKQLAGFTKLTGKDADERKAKIVALANETIANLVKGTVKKKGAKSKADKADSAVMSEAVRIAKEMIKDHLRSQGIKLSSRKQSEITKAAKDVVEANPDLLKKAAANLAERAEGAKTTAKLDLKTLFGAGILDETNKVKPKGAGLKKANEAKAAKKAESEGAVRSKPAADGGKVAPPVRPKASAPHHTAH